MVEQTLFSEETRDSFCSLPCVLSRIPGIQRFFSPMIVKTVHCPFYRSVPSIETLNVANPTIMVGAKEKRPSYRVFCLTEVSVKRELIVLWNVIRNQIR